MPIKKDIKNIKINTTRDVGCTQNVRLRSANRGNANNTWNVNSSGNINNNNASNANAFSPIAHQFKHKGYQKLIVD